jgi:ubiquinone/menaquinone biosynthesis C-methylase UbiE
MCKVNSKTEIKEAYEKEAEIYDKTRWWFQYGRFAYMERKLLSDLLRRKGRVLFVACGTGRHIRFAVNQLGCEVIGLDLAKNMIEIARRKLSKTEKERVHFLVADAEHLPFRENAFDGAVCSRAFYLFIDKFKALREAYYVLKSGGKLLLSSVFMDLFLTRLGIRVGVFSADPADFPYTSELCASMLKKAGFQKVHRRCITFLTGDLWFLPPPVLRIISLIESISRGGRWVMVIGEKT